MADFTLKQGDTRPTLSITLQQGSPATAINLTSATSVTLHMRSGAGGTVISRVAAITSAANGVIAVTFQAADVATAGSYQAEVEISWSGAKETIPNTGYLTIEIIDDIA